MCNEIDYEMIEEYLARPKQKDQKEKEPEKPLEAVAS
jgi:hypothetical protein